MKRLIAAAVIAAVAGMGVTACNSSAPAGQDVSAVCIDQHTNMRLDDDECEDDDGISGWWYFAAGAAIPAVGHHVAKSSGSYKKPPRAHVRKQPRMGVAKPSLVKPPKPSASKPRTSVSKPTQTTRKRSWLGSSSSGSKSKSSSRSGGSRR
ncbi:hypothetical protein SEA_OCTOBIEN14_57 [Gordonia phage Octobien14]|uniref:Lipoprotein n=1 Tax=Gordonia phage Octobien14 TaxID=2483673 RepID=A0A3G3M9R8_9CAUD|nr:hypothetical protein L3Y22_gp057 [Gordonia phage Octobien14]AYR03203.1 hypothetical protein SEA_OCTOBIEN14_57 [Gordonia phage Octobien14]